MADGALMARIQLHKIAHGRAGDKGNRSNIGLIPYRDEDYDLLAEQVTVEAVRIFFEGVVKGEITRHDLPNLKAFNFVLDEALEGGVNDALAVDTHGKSRASILLCMEIDVPENHWVFEEE
ncbi:MAG: hypothetical protein CMM28_09420 [Rhodospirillaceae bacterium]|nr:hypothetical protein [Rhodospirillaceae bacterium]